MACFRRVVKDLKASLDSGGVEGLARTHSEAAKTCWSYRVFCWFLELMYPVSALLDLYRGLDRQVAERGIAEASDAILDMLPTTWRAELPAGREGQIRTAPIVVFGKHGSVLTPFFVAAALRRPDMKMLGASYVAKVGPTVATHVYTVHLPTPTLRRATRRGILLRVGAWFIAKIDREIAKDVAREENRASLARAAEHVCDGGALLIAPDTPNPRAKWRSGIGHLLAHLASGDAASCGAYLVPYRIWASLTGLFHLLSKNPFLRLLGRWEYRRPIRVAFGEPLLLSDVIEQTGREPVEITEFLETYYRGLGF